MEKPADSTDLPLFLRTPQEWRALIDTIKDRVVRVQVACIVWWDYFGKQEVKDRWPHLDDYLYEWKWSDNAKSNKCIKELERLGYSHYHAAQRFIGEYNKRPARIGHARNR